MGLSLNAATPALERGASDVPRWRDADEQLLLLLEDERAVVALHRHDAAADAPKLPRRASVLAHEARKLPGGSEAVASAAAGHPKALSKLLRSGMEGWPPALCHAAASYFARLAASPVSRAAELDAHVRRFAAWIALADQKTYVVDLVTQLASGTMDESEIERLALGGAERVVTDLGKAALSGAKDLSPRAGVALAALARTPEACSIACVTRASGARIAARAEQARATAIDEALSGAADAIADAKTREPDIKAYLPSMTRVRDVWHWSDKDEAVERFAVDQLVPIGWEFYRQSAWNHLRELLAPCEALVDNLESRILAKPIDRISYAANCAQAILFRSETETDRAREWALAERALAVCPSHRNSRLDMAHLLADRAIHLLARSTIFSGRSDVAEATKLVERAESLFPQSRRGQEARAKLDQARAKWGAP